MKMKALCLCIVTLALLTSAAVAQVDPMPPDLAEKAANLLVRGIPTAEAAPFKVDATAEGTVGMTAQGGLAIVVVPARGLTAEKVSAAGDEPVPVGVIVMKGVQLLADGKPFPADKMVRLGRDAGHQIPALWLAAQKVDGKLSLVFCGKDKETRAVPLADATGDAEKPVALSFVGLEGERSGRFAMTLCGKFKASFLVGAERGQ